MQRSPREKPEESKLVAAWAVLPTLLVFVEAIHRLAHRAVTTVKGPMRTADWVALVVVVVLFTYGEGHLALQRRFAPAVIARAMAAGRGPVDPIALARAPFEAVALMGGTRATRAQAWCGVALIGVAIAVVRALPSPWRGIVDAGVAAALSWGLAALAVQFASAMKVARSDASTTSAAPAPHLTAKAPAPRALS